MKMKTCSHSFMIQPSKESNMHNLKTILFFISTAIFRTDASARNNIIIKGTTVAPGFIRPSSKLSEPCQESHKYAYGGGKLCCKTRRKATAEGPKLLDIYDPVEECKDGNFITCPFSSCKTGIFEGRN